MTVDSLFIRTGNLINDAVLRNIRHFPFPTKVGAKQTRLMTSSAYWIERCVWRHTSFNTFYKQIYEIDDTDSVKYIDA